MSLSKVVPTAPCSRSTFDGNSSISMYLKKVKSINSSELAIAKRVYLLAQQCASEIRDVVSCSTCEQSKLNVNETS